jgi:ClpA/ClpB-like protein
MFDRYTEKSRRVLQFARENASKSGAASIESQHLLLGILRETPSVLSEQFRQKLEQMQSELDAPDVKGARISEEGLPLSNECKRILAYAAEEAERLAHRHIGTEHLFLGVLREEKCTTAKIMRSHGIKVEDERLRIARDAELHGVTSRQVDVFSALAVGSGVIVGHTAARGRTIEFRSESDDSVLGTAPGFDVPRLGDEIAVGTLRGRVIRVVQNYVGVPEEGPLMAQLITVYIRSELGPCEGATY